MAFLFRFLEWLDFRASWLLPIYVGAYITALAPAMARPLWYDELLTYYICKFGTISNYLEGIVYFDSNPPLGFLLTASSLRIFGDSPLALRLPAAAAFLVASLTVFAIVSRRLGGFFGLSAMVLFWSCGYLYYAAEARPYALLLAFLSLALFFWMKIQESDRFTRDHWLLSLSLAGMLLSHCTGLFFVFPFWFGEALRSHRRRKFEHKMWATLWAPLAVTATYVPLFIAAHKIRYAREMWPSLESGGTFYAGLAYNLGLVVWFPLAAAILTSTPYGSRSRLRSEEKACLAGILLTPIAIMVYFRWSEVAFYPRYGIGAIIAFTIGLVFYVSRKFRGHVAAGTVAALVTLGVFVFRSPSSHFAPNWEPPAMTLSEYRDIYPKLPFVAASGITFLEMDHAEPPEFVGRLYYLIDRDSARHADQAHLDSMNIIPEYFPLRATVMPYKKFVQLHNHFLISSHPDSPFEWVRDKLRDDGAEIRPIPNVRSPYRNERLYEVMLGQRLGVAEPDGGEKAAGRTHAGAEQPADAGQHAAGGTGRLGARLLTEVPERAPGVH